MAGKAGACAASPSGCCQAELTEAGTTEVFSFRVLREILARDPEYRRFMTCMALFGAGNLMIWGQLVIIFTDHLHLSAAKQVSILTIVPLLCMPLFTPLWARMFDAGHVIEFRARQCWVTVAGMAVVIVAVYTRLPAAAVVRGAAVRHFHRRRQPRLEPRPQRFRIAGQGAAIYGRQRDADRHARADRAAARRHRVHAAGAAGTGGGAAGIAAAPGLEPGRRHRLQSDETQQNGIRARMKAKSKQFDPRQHSSLVVDGLKNAPARAMLRAVGFRTRISRGRRSAWLRPGRT